MSDALFDGRRLKLLTMVDNFTRECLAIETGQGITGDQVTGVLSGVATSRSFPGRIKCDNGRSLHQRPWTNGPMNTTLSWTFQGLENPQTMDILNLLMGV